MYFKTIAMKRTTLLWIGLLFVSLTFAQEQAIRITSPNSDREIIIKENKRVKIRTADGQKITGRFTIEDPQTLLIKGQRIELLNIESIKRNPLLLSIFTSGFFIYAGAITVGMSAIIGLFADSSAFWLALPGAAMIYTGIKSPNFNKNYKKSTDWKFELITTSQ